MPPKAKKAQKATGDAMNGKAEKPAPPTAAPQPKPVPAAATQEEVHVKPTSWLGKPDQVAYHGEQDSIKAEIDVLQGKLSVLKDQISLATKNGPGTDRRIALRAEMETLRGQQSSSKTSRGKLLEQLKSIQDETLKKAKDLQAAKSKAPYKTVAEVDSQIKHLERQVESGSMKLGDEKRALQEISSLKRSRRTVESFQADQEAIEADRAKTDLLRKQLDDPEARAISDRYEAIRSELDQIRKSSEEAFADRNKLFDERNALQTDVDALFARKRDSAQRFREASDQYWQKVNEERAKRAERLKAQRAAEEEEKRKEVVDRLLEEAKVPAFQAKVEDCQTLIDYFTARVAGGSMHIPPPTSLSTSKPDVAGVPKLELRQVDQDVGNGLVPRKKKGDNEENYFVGGKGKGKKGNKGGAAANGATSSSSTALNLQFSTLAALMELSIPPPASTVDLPRVIEDLKTKKDWFEANQDRVTAENIAKAESQIQRLVKGVGAKTEQPPSPTAPNGKVDTLSQSTPASNGDEPSDAVASEVAEDKVEEAKNEQGAEVEVEAAEA